MISMKLRQRNKYLFFYPPLSEYELFSYEFFCVYLNNFYSLTANFRFTYYYLDLSYFTIRRHYCQYAIKAFTLRITINGY